MKRTELPDQGLVFWPVGAGDSTTVLVNREIIMQVDLNHLEAAHSDDDPRWPVGRVPAAGERQAVSGCVCGDPR